MGNNDTKWYKTPNDTQSLTRPFLLCLYMFCVDQERGFHEYDIPPPSNVYLVVRCLPFTLLSPLVSQSWSPPLPGMICALLFSLCLLCRLDTPPNVWCLWKCLSQIANKFNINNSWPNPWLLCCHFLMTPTITNMKRTRSVTRTEKMYVIV